MSTGGNVLVSFVIVTHNRREALLATLAHLRHAALRRDEYEVWVVDNASTDGTVEAVRAEHPDVRLILREENEGVGARSHAFGRARGRYLVLLDDDSYPVDDTVPRSIAYLDANPGVAAVVGRVVLPDGSLEACAMPAVMLSGAVCIRKRVLDEVGGFRPEFFRKAGEYDLSFRMWQAGYRVERFEDLVYRHDKVMTGPGRSSSFAHYMDLRNNLILIERYLPRDMRRIYRRDWLRRYAAIARAAGEEDAVKRAIAEGRQWARREAAAGRQTLGPAALETIFEWSQQQRLIEAWARRHRIRRVAVADYAKNIYATFRACRGAGLDITCVLSDSRAFAGHSYRGVPILPPPEGLAPAHRPDGVVISNVNPAQIDGWRERIAQQFDGPLLTLWQPKQLADVAAAHEEAA